ncbi:NagC family transcriptional regulator, partial [Gardnerella vaginalis]
QSGSVFVDAFRESLHRLLFPDVLTPIQVVVASNLTNCSALGAALEGIDAAEKIHHKTSQHL